MLLPLKVFDKGIIFQNVSFAYQQKKVLNNVSFEIPKGHSVALVGPSGGGKSTLMDLIPRFIQPQSGNIFIDNTDISYFTIESLRDIMGIVNQESILYNASIFNNIAFGKPGSTLEQVETAAKNCECSQFHFGYAGWIRI